MFSEKKSNPQNMAERNLIGSTTSIKGDIQSDGDFRIEGKIEGNIKITGKIIIGAKGSVIGNVECGSADIEGAFNGKLIVNGILLLKQTARLDGEVYIQKLSVEPGATFNAKCEMSTTTKGSVDAKTSTGKK